MMQTDKKALTEKTLKLLEFDCILERLAGFAASEETSAIIREEKPLGDPGAVTNVKNAVQAVISRVNSGDAVPGSALPSVGFLFQRLEVEGIALETDEACAIGLFIERGEELKKWLAPLPPLPAIPDGIPDCAQLAAAIFRVIDREGNMRDLPELRAIRQKIRRLNAGLETAVSRYTADDETRKMLQSAVPSQRDGRSVLAVKANFRGRIRGIVHEVSSSGQTVFVEPEDVVEKNNEILIENRKLGAEIKKIMMNLTGRIAGSLENIKAFHLSVLRIDVIMAKARYSLATAGVFALESKEPLLVLSQARHPLVKDAVPIDLAMDRARALIITGPNTGGKTVTLKTAGLLAMMNQTGLALPAAEGMALPVFDGIYADIGDEQSIGQSLSTFSAHITNIAAIIACSTGNSLALLDELGSGTDPQEGSAIAMAVLDCLIERETRLLVTTHHGILKNYGYSRPEVENASVEFDPRTLSPTYRIITGVPGESRALEIAGRNGLPAEIVARAASYIEDGHSDISALISGLKEKHRDLDSLAVKARNEERLLRDERRKSDLKELRLRQKELELKAGFAGKLRSLLDESRKTLENLVRELKESPPAAEGALAREKTLKVKEFLGDLARTVEAEDAALEEEEAAAAALLAGNAGGAGKFAPGMEVFAGGGSRRGRLVRPGKKNRFGNTWIVETGSLRVSFPESALVPAAPLKTGSFTASLDLAGSPAARPEINLCGMRLEEALESLRRQIDSAALQGLGVFSVVHGKGDGILQKGVHDLLKKEPAVADYYFARPEFGGFGKTEVILK